MNALLNGVRTKTAPTRHELFLSLDSIRKDQAQTAVRGMCNHHKLDYSVLVERGNQVNERLSRSPALLVEMSRLTQEEWITLAMANMVSNENLNHWCGARAFIFKLVDSGLSRDGLTPKQATAIGRKLLERWGCNPFCFTLTQVNY